MTEKFDHSTSCRLAGTVLAFAVFLLSLVPATSLGKEVKPDDPAIRYIGRFTDDYRFAWTGSEIETLVKGESITADLEVVAAGPAGLTVVVDDEPRYLKIGKESQTYTLADGLNPDRIHRVSIVKRSEGARGTVRFGGFGLPDGGELIRPEGTARKLLVIGDSITCGYGNEAEEPSEGNTVDNQNGYMSYALIAAREFDADAMLICWSGRGMFRNRSKHNDQSGTLPEVFDQILPFDADTHWDHARFVPDVIVINLGTNDFAELDGAKPPLNKDDFIGAYTTFLSRLRSLAPDSELILAIGPMQAGPVPGWLPEIASRFEGASVLVFSKYSGKEDIGGHWHPSVRKAETMAHELAALIESTTDWKIVPD